MAKKAAARRVSPKKGARARLPVQRRTRKPRRAQAIKLRRVTKRFSQEPFVLGDYTLVTETFLPDGSGTPQRMDYLQGWVPLDCIDDVTKAKEYNPRKPRQSHRSKLMDDIGAFGLVQPLVVALERRPSWLGSGPAQPSQQAVTAATGDDAPARLFLLDGRHRYQGLLHLVPGLRDEVNRSHGTRNARRRRDAVDNTVEFVQHAPAVVVSRLQAYGLPTEQAEDGSAMPMVPVKVYLDPDEVRRIDLAVFLNTGQKRLSAGEEAIKVAEALEIALAEETQGGPSRTASEAAAVTRVGANTKRKGSNVVLAWFAAQCMEPTGGSPWYPILSKYQNDREESGSGVTGGPRPLTVKNFTTFLRPLLNVAPKVEHQPAVRQQELERLNRLGAVFQQHFQWSETPRANRPYTATGQLCRSFVISALAAVLARRLGPQFLSSPRAGDDMVWRDLDVSIGRLHEALENQAKWRADHDSTFASFRKAVQNGQEEKAVRLAGRLQELQGKLWSMNTVKGALEPFLEQELGVELQPPAPGPAIASAAP